MSRVFIFSECARPALYSSWFQVRVKHGTTFCTSDVSWTVNGCVCTRAGTILIWLKIGLQSLHQIYSCILNRQNHIQSTDFIYKDALFRTNYRKDCNGYVRCDENSRLYESHAMDVWIPVESNHKLKCCCAARQWLEISIYVCRVNIR